MAQKVCLVTGASSGLAKSAALARQGATVILACRDRSKGEAARAEIKGASELLFADLGSQRSVRDVLVNNAAVYKTTRTVSADGLETMFATNYLGHFLLTILLLDALQSSPSTRVINVAAPVTTHLDFDDLQSEKRFSTNEAFGASKRCNLLFSNALHPGLVKSNLVHEAPGPMRWISNLISKTLEQAAEAIACLALSPELEGISGKFFKGKTPGQPDPYSQDGQVQHRLWDISAALVTKSLT